MGFLLRLVVLEVQVGCRGKKKIGCRIVVRNHLRHFLERKVGPFQREEFASIERNCSGVVGSRMGLSLQLLLSDVGLTHSPLALVSHF